MITTNKQKWSYLAALFDGEGCITISLGSEIDKSTGHKNLKFDAEIHIVNTSLVLMKWLISYFGGVYYFQASKNPKHKDRWIWKPKGSKNRQLILLGILPYLVIKREQAIILLEFERMDGERNPEKRMQFRNKITLLNKKGKSVTTNTQDGLINPVIESELISNDKSTPTTM